MTDTGVPVSFDVSPSSFQKWAEAMRWVFTGHRGIALGGYGGKYRDSFIHERPIRLRDSPADFVITVTPIGAIDAKYIDVRFLCANNLKTRFNEFGARIWARRLNPGWDALGSLVADLDASLEVKGVFTGAVSRPTRVSGGYQWECAEGSRFLGGHTVHLILSCKVHLAGDWRASVEITSIHGDQRLRDRIPITVRP